jgi:hypothetical protein
VTLPLSISAMAGEVSLRWNQIYPNLLAVYRRLKELGIMDGGEEAEALDAPP